MFDYQRVNQTKDFCCGAKEHREAAVLSGAVPKLLTLLVPSCEAEAGHCHSLGRCCCCSNVTWWKRLQVVMVILQMGLQLVFFVRHAS